MNKHAPRLFGETVLRDAPCIEDTEQLSFGLTVGEGIASLSVGDGVASLNVDNRRFRVGGEALAAFARLGVSAQEAADRIEDARAAGFLGVAMPEKQQTTAAEILRKAADLLEERGKTYDTAAGERSWTRVTKAFNIIAGRDLKVEEVLLLMGIVKDVRQYIAGKRHEDSALDGVAYAALEAEEIMKELQEAEC